MHYKCFDKNGVMYAQGNIESVALASVDLNGGWAEDETGKVVAGRKPAGTIDATPTWKSLLPILIEGLTNGNEAGQKNALESLTRMAEAADAYNASIKD